MAKKIKKYKVGIDSETYAISLVESPAIESDFVALSKEEEDKLQVFLESEEKHMVYGAALIPDKDIYRNNGEQEFYISFSKESIEKMSQEYMKEYRQWEVKTDHDDIANEVCVVESWLVSDSYKDKSNALGINVPEGTWMVGMKVNNIETWDRIRQGELKGFSVESMISLEEFSKQNDNNMTIETNEMGFWSKMKEILRETFSSMTDEEKEAVAELNNVPAEEINLEEQPVAEPTPAPEPTVEPEPVAEPTPEPEPEPVVEQPKADNSHLEELINNLKAEIEALKETNNGLQERIADMGKQPSVNPVNTNAKPSATDTYSAWREQMAKYL